MTMPSTDLHVDALLLDMDGTLVDSTASVERSWRAWALQHDLVPGEILAAAHGVPALATIRKFAPAGTDVAAEAHALVTAELEDTNGIVPIPGAAALLQALPEGKWAVVTSAGRRLALQRMQAAGLAIPKILISADDVQKGKPDPEGYRTAARLLGVAPSQCLVIEDTPAGLEAGRRAGAALIGVCTTYTPAHLCGSHDIVTVPDLSSLKISVLSDGRIRIMVHTA